ncbi:MAG: AAA family ATPase [Ignavibacteria bacterium]|jgi:AAA+ ATPase superfamily predicted ATPase|nr:AAA family ATPase [Ignavibacteria bacterium]
MKKEIEFKQYPAFINREHELNFLRNFIQDIPNRLLFIFGPKSSGKTTLLYKFIEEIEKNPKYDLMFFNLRKMLIVNYSEFIRVFFSATDDSPAGESKRKYEYDLKVFKLSYESIEKIEKKEYDPFIVMAKELQKIKMKGKVPIIIIDELQALSDIYFNGQRELLNELFNFFVAMTKESHLCHVIISSSDGYFIERIYSDSKLHKTSSFFEVDYLEKEDIFYWLNNLEKESGIRDYILTEKQIEIAWHYFGGSVWEISELLSNLFLFVKDGAVSDEDIINFCSGKIRAFAIRFLYYKPLKYDSDLFIAFNEVLKKKESVLTKDLMTLNSSFKKDDLINELGNLVQKNLFSYNPVTGVYKPQGHSIQLGLELYCKEYAINWKSK